MQIITYNEFLPALLGASAMPAYRGYDPAIDPTVANEFSTALFRFGHSMLVPQLLLVDNQHETVGQVSLRDAFFNPGFFIDQPVNLDYVLHGLAYQPARELDNVIVEDVRNFLFGPPGAGGLDLASLNIQRGRDHGIPDYNTLCAAYGLDPAADFDQISSVPDVSHTLQEIYARVDNIDAWVGALAEDHVTSSSVGRLIRAGLVDQFTRLREGDRFFYLNDPDLSHPDIAAVIDLDGINLAEIIHLNTEIGRIHTPFFVEHAGQKPKAGDANGDFRFDSLDIVQVQLAGKYATGQSANWSEGDWNGDGVFDQFDIIAALQTGSYLSA
jgi:hypothetical protein